ncbi:MAG TPA: PHP domain-containing protein, partial [Myxococcaceae bacterium]|nr:PHP domain-containing protein [Myxococcaceae bacterium]
MSFTHLHLHTLYSLLDGAIRMKDLIKAVREKGMSSVAVTDHGNMFGAIDFYKKAKEAGVRPILGTEAYVAGPKGRGDRTEKISNHLILLAKNEEGYANLRYLVSTAFMDGFYYHPRIDKVALKEHHRGLIGLTACLGGEVTSACLRGDLDNARRAALEYKEIFEPGHFFLEIQSNGMPEQEKANENLKQLSRDCKLPLVATADAHYIKREDAKAHELLMCIASGKTLADSKRMRQSTDRLYVMSPEEMRAYFSDVPEAVD